MIHAGAWWGAERKQKEKGKKEKKKGKWKWIYGIEDLISKGRRRRCEMLLLLSICVRERGAKGGGGEVYFVGRERGG